MSKLVVQSDDGATEVEIAWDGWTEEYEAYCPTCPLGPNVLHETRGRAVLADAVETVHAHVRNQHEEASRP